jgi:hypothetical protein
VGEAERYTFDKPVDRLSTSEWGQKAIEQLAAFIQSQETGIKGFEKRNLERSVSFTKPISIHKLRPHCGAIELDST